ncbi:hypothetical protein [Meridianimarinicoccus aquatilis]|uniref:Dihydrodipicolinate reductase n=1 Tax=Meridianimarinicoccus aquatilis TaxID=2552766 RepID=A0A4R6AV16_9RHOB|nr:hypothetical protein [Fluviibacterium aquatile]QIE41770.1 hypothetical protein G5B39_07255 [Rhodobacteraceae bacterium SC52]TDL88060.1 hypothetical protein E2L05_09160 [Fluviibacterium aquatile]
MRTICSVLGMIVLLSACGNPDVSSYGSVGETAESLERRRAFNNAIVGHTLRGEGVDVTVAEGGALVGTHLGVPFVGSWEYRRGLFCTSMRSEDVRRAMDRRCYRAASDGRTVTLVQTSES